MLDVVDEVDDILCISNTEGFFAFNWSDFNSKSFFFTHVWFSNSGKDLLDLFTEVTITSNWNNSCAAAWDSIVSTAGIHWN